MIDPEAVLEKLGVENKRVGNRVWAERCPLTRHQHHNPKHRWQNFFVRASGERAGQFHCFSCGGGGRLVDLVMDVTGRGMRDALAWLADLEQQAPAHPFLRVRVVGARERFAMPDGVEGGPLEEWNSVARDYAQKDRGITPGQVLRWRLGYALIGRLAGRVVIPVHDAKGRLANYTGRTFVGDEVRYLSAQEREGPDLSAFWGEHEWAGLTTALVFEGAINGMAFERAFVATTGHLTAALGVALAGLSGSSFDHRKAMKLTRFRRLIVATDPDPAGDDAFEDIWAAMHRECAVERFVYPGSDDAAATPPHALQGAVARQCLG